MATIPEVIDFLDEISEDSSASRNLKAKIIQIVGILRAEGDVSMKVNKASHELDELASSNEIDSYTRTQLLHIVSALENVEN